MIELEVLTDADGSIFVSTGKFGVQDTSGNFYGEFDSYQQACKFIDDEMKLLAGAK